MQSSLWLGNEILVRWLRWFFQMCEQFLELNENLLVGWACHMSADGFTPSGLHFYSVTESSFQGIPAEKNVLEDISKGFLIHPSNVKGHGGALPRRPSVLGCCELAVSHREQHSFLFFAKIGFCFLLVMETGQIIYNDRTRTLWGGLLSWARMPWGSPSAGDPTEADECRWQEVTGGTLVMESLLDVLSEACLTLCVSLSTHW